MPKKYPPNMKKYDDDDDEKKPNILYIIYIKK